MFAPFSHISQGSTRALLDFFVFRRWSRAVMIKVLSGTYLEILEGAKHSIRQTEQAGCGRSCCWQPSCYLPCTAFPYGWCEFPLTVRIVAIQFQFQFHTLSVVVDQAQAMIIQQCLCWKWHATCAFCDLILRVNRTIPTSCRLTTWLRRRARVCCWRSLSLQVVRHWLCEWDGVHGAPDHAHTCLECGSDIQVNTRSCTHTCGYGPNTQSA